MPRHLFRPPVPGLSLAISVLALLPLLPQAARAQATDPVLGQIICAAFGFAPRGWARLDGQLLSIQQNQALFALLGTQYGGNGTTNFALPDMRSRVLKHQGQGTGLPNYTTGQAGGSTGTTLSVAQLPGHAHTVSLPATTAPASSVSLADAVPAQYSVSRAAALYAAAPGTVPMAPVTVVPAGAPSPQPVQTEPPYAVLNCFIALQGVFPSPN